jgi:hypothetical protein
MSGMQYRLCRGNATSTAGSQNLLWAVRKWDGRTDTEATTEAAPSLISQIRYRSGCLRQQWLAETKIGHYVLELELALSYLQRRIGAIAGQRGAEKLSCDKSQN